MIYRCLIGFLFLYSVNSWSSEEISIALEDADNSPFEKVSVDQKSVTGFHIEMINAVAESIGKKVRWVPLPWSRAIDSGYKGSVDAISFISEGGERRKNLIFLSGNELHTDRICVFIRKDFEEKNKYDGTLESLFGEKVGIARDYFLNKEIEEKKHKFNLMETTTVGAQMYAMLTAGRIDYVFGSEYSMKRLGSGAGQTNITTAGSCTHGEKRFIAFSKKKRSSQKSAEEFEDALIKWKRKPEYRKLKSKYKI